MSYPVGARRSAARPFPGSRFQPEPQLLTTLGSTGSPTAGDGHS
jgi:hypothetical protein